MSPFAAEALAEGLRTPMRDPVCTAVFCGIDSMLAPVVDRADDAQAPGAVSRVEKGRSMRDLAGANWPHVALSGGSDVTGLDVSLPDGRLDSAVRVGVRSEEGLRDVVIRGDLLADGVEGFARVLEGQLRAVQ